MSAEFEKIVLEKLNILDELKTEVKNLSKKFDNLEEKVVNLEGKVENNSILINTLSKKFDNLEEKVKNNSISINTLSKKIDNLEEKVKNNSISINTLSKKIDNLEEKVNNNTNSISTLARNININTDLMATLSKQIEQQGLNFAKFEHEFTVKVQSLFDSFVANTESHLAYEKSIAVLHAKSFDHNNRISVLEDYFKDTKLLATN